MTALLELEDFSVLRGRRAVVQGVSLALGAGETWALVGPNGAGKSTLLDGVVGALPHSGRLLHRGERLDRLGARERARRVTLTGRELGRDAFITVRSWVELGRLPHLSPWHGPSERDRRAVDDALDQANALELAERPIGALSDGERQRAYFARALAQAPDVLLLDEATAHLDLAQREQTIERVRRYVGRERAALLAIHDLDLAVRQCSHVAVLMAGTLMAQGEIVATLNPRLLAAVFGVRAEVQRDARGNSLRVFGAAPVRPLLTVGERA